MLSAAKQTRLLENLKKYSKKYLNGKITELDESGTRLMINSFLTDVLGYAPIEEIKTEYMIKGTYADYVIQLDGIRHFLVEVKALSLTLSDAHLRQATNYGANEGIEWAVLTNGRSFNLYKILFNKPVESRRVFSFDFAEAGDIKKCVDLLQYLHREAVGARGLEMLWNKCCALDPANVAGLLYGPPVTNFIKKHLKDRFKHKFSDEDIKDAITRVICDPISLDRVKPLKVKKERSVKLVKPVEQVVVELADPLQEPLPVSSN